MAASRKMPTRLAIYEYWHFLNGREVLEKIGVVLEVQRDLFGKVKHDCFACGDASDLQRCHTSPRVGGGLDTVDNLHLLCTRCHVESEMLSGEKYWSWLKFMVTNRWLTANEHADNRLEKLGFTEQGFFDAYVKGGSQGGLDYLAYFVADSAEEHEHFMTAITERLKKLQTATNRRSVNDD